VKYSKTNAREGVLKVLKALLVDARRKEEGIIAGVDPEFLHKYRVRLRKARSLLALLKGVFPKEKTLEWKKKLGDFCRSTNALRDWDVYFKDLTKSRHIEALKVSSFLKSSKYRKGMLSLEKEWQQALALEKSTSSSLPISEVAGGAIAESFRTIRKFYTRISGQASDATIHRIRIECKKMRYLLESFSDFFPDHDLAGITRQLTQVQNRLGRYNDHSIQRVHLIGVVKKNMRSENERLILALGCLIGGLHHEQAILKKKALSALEDFCSRKNAQLVDALEK
jgi:CHAD domain-containing protein